MQAVVGVTTCILICVASAYVAFDKIDAKALGFKKARQFSAYFLKHLILYYAGIVVVGVIVWVVVEVAILFREGVQWFLVAALYPFQQIFF